ncbi:MAG: HAD family hydrolase [Actinobacteria bacterium]|nr:HAD family hydrolase [Actinomycetota bacterium]MBI3686569.1 HAD family hydrolase [Actinomycetota bacterium]
MTVRALACDFGGTLARPGLDPDGETVAAVLRDLNGTWVPRGFAAVFDAVHRRVWEADRATARQTPFAEEIRRAAAACGAVVADPVAATEALFSAVPDAEVDRDAARALRYLHDGGLVCVLACDTQRPRAVRLRTLEAAGIGSCFDAVVLSSTVGVRKPHPQFYDAVVAGAGFPAADILFVGDTLAKDVLGPLAHGLRAVLVAPDGYPSGADEGIVVIRRFADLPAYLAVGDVG